MDKDLLNKIEVDIIDILQTEIKDTIVETRNNMIVVEEKSDGDSATIADIKIGEIFESKLPQLLPNSIVIQEESFNKDIYNTALTTKYVWVVDPIDGTKAFRDINNFEWCVGVCLLEDLNPILSLVYIPEKWLNQSYLLSANKFRDSLYNFGKPFSNPQKEKNYQYISHIHRDSERNKIEENIANLFKDNETIKAYAGHSTLAQFTSVAINQDKVFSRRGANIWDIIQGAYLIQKSGGEVFYKNGENIFPLNPKVLEYKDNHLIMPFTIGCNLEIKEKILKAIDEK